MKRIQLNTVYDDDADVRTLNITGLINLLERGNWDDWQPLLQCLREEPFGPVADRVLQAAPLVFVSGTGELFEAVVCKLRGEPLPPLRPKDFRSWP